MQETGFKSYYNNDIHKWIYITYNTTPQRNKLKVWFIFYAAFLLSVSLAGILSHKEIVCIKKDN